LWAIDKIWPTLDTFYYSYFHKWKNWYFRSLYKQNYFIWHEKKGKSKRCHRKSEKKKVNLRVLKMNLYVLKGVLQSCLDPFVPFQMILGFWWFYLVPLLHLLFYFGCFSWWCVPYKSTFEVNGHLGGFWDPFVMFCSKAILFFSLFSPIQKLSMQINFF